MEELTERELAIAEKAADMAVKKVIDEFYMQAGKTVVGKLIWLIGAVAVGFALSKGWIKLGD